HHRAAPHRALAGLSDHIMRRPARWRVAAAPRRHRRLRPRRGLQLHPAVRPARLGAETKSTQLRAAARRARKAAVMSGTSKSTQDTQQQSQTNPWAPTIGTLQGLIGGIGGLMGNIAPTGAAAAALNSIQQNAGGNLPAGYGQAATDYAGNLISGGP